MLQTDASMDNQCPTVVNTHMTIVHFVCEFINWLTLVKL